MIAILEGNYFALSRPVKLIFVARGIVPGIVQIKIMEL